MKRWIFMLISILSLAGCGEIPPAEFEERVRGTYVTRIIDYDAQVVCWVARSASISCLPISDTALSGVRPQSLSQ